MYSNHLPTYGDHYSRLTAITTRHDPDNLFRVNQNIQPARSASDPMGAE
jgi:hypothetical protein